MTVLLVGAVYWVWTQIQYVQRKVNILENIVYELKTLCAKSQPPDVYLGSVGSSTESSYLPAPSSVLDEDEDLLHETLHKEVQESSQVDVSTRHEETIQPFEEDERSVTQVAENHTEEEEAVESDVSPFLANDDQPINGFDALQPGGIGSGIVAPVSIETLSVKDLRRLAEQKGIQNANELRKKELLAAIRALPKDLFDQ